MKVLMLYSYYEPEIAASMYLWTNINEALAQAGHFVEVYTPRPTRGIDGVVRNEYKKKKIESFLKGGIVIRRFYLPNEKKGILSRMFRYILLNVALLWKGLVKDTDLIFLYSTPPTNGLVAYLLKRLRRVPVVYDIQDMFPESLIATQMTTENSLIYKIGEKVEKITYKGADHFIVISQDFKERILKKGVPKEKISVIRNWVDENAVRRIPRNQNRVLKKYGLDENKFYVTYCGNIGFTQNVELILKVAENLKYEKDIMFLLFGEGAYKEVADRCIVEKELNNVKIFPFQEYEYISDVFSIGNIGIIASKSGVGGCSVPSKTWSYMSAECAIVASFDEKTELIEILKEAQCGYTCVPDDTQMLEQQILKLYQDREKCEKLGRNGREYIMNCLTREIGTKKYLEILEKLYMGKE